MNTVFMEGSVMELEATYKRALSAYPKRWREEQGDEFVGVLLDVARSESRTSPTTSELANILGNGLMARALELVGHINRRRRDALAFTATVLATYLAVTMMLLGESGPWVRSATLRWRPTGQGFSDHFLPLGPFTTAASLVYLILLAACVSTVLRRTALRRSLFLSAAATAPLVSLAGALTNTVAPPLHTMLAISLLAVGALAGNPASTASRGIMLSGAAVIFTCGGLTLAVSRLSAGGAFFFYNPLSVASVDAHTLTLATAVLMTVAALIVTSGARLLPATVALVVLVFPQLARLWFGLPDSHGHTYMTAYTGLWQESGPVAAAAVTAGVITALLLRAFRSRIISTA